MFNLNQQQPLSGSTDRAAEIYLGLMRKVLKTNDLGQPGWRALQFLKKRDYLGLLDLADELSSTVYDDAASHFKANQLSYLIKKYPFTTNEAPGVNPELAALKKFKAAEHRCKRINQRFRASRKHGFRHASLLERARAWIEYVIGSKPNLERIYDQGGFGPGAAYGVTGNATHMGRKLHCEAWTVTPSAIPHALNAIWANAQWREAILSEEGKAFHCLDKDTFRDRVMARVRVVSNNKLAFVPKTTKTHRSIAVEPLLNGYIQKGIDSELRLRLRRVGLDLRNQEMNQALARLGSLGGDDPYVTIDLSAASDSVSLQLVKELLPTDWFLLFDQTRSPAYSYKNIYKEVRYEKLSSMGNGFTFPVETLIFASLAHACYGEVGRPDDFRVYGDDIIVRQSVAHRLIEVLDFCGFATNRDKTFLDGPFRESCGKDWFGGEDVRPIILDFRFDQIESFFKFHNATLTSERTKSFFNDDVRSWLRSLVPDNMRFVRVFKGQPDSAFEVPQDVFMVSPHLRYNKDIQRYEWKELHHTACVDPLFTKKRRSRSRYHDNVMMMAALFGLQSQDGEPQFTVRRETRTSIRFVA